MKNVAVFFGGRSPEREISVITGVFVLNSLDKTQYNPIAIFIDGDGKFYTGDKLSNLEFYKSINRKAITECSFLAGDNKLYKLKNGRVNGRIDIYAAINCLHGKCGEDGSLSGYAATCNLPLLSAGIFAEAMSIDKDFTKLVLKSIDVKTVDYVRIKRERFFENGDLAVKFVGDKLGYPVIVKPSRLGSSIGIEKADDPNSLFSALTNAFCYDDKVVCEKYLQCATDVNCAVYGTEKRVCVSRVEQTSTTHDLLTFDDKYGNRKLSGSFKNDLPPIDERLQNEIKSVCEKIYKRFEFTSIVRFDFLLCNGKAYLNEINAIPGSLAYYFFCEKISDFGALLSLLLHDCAERYRKQKNLLSSFKSNVLCGDWKGIKK